MTGNLNSKWGKQGNSQPKSMLFGEHKEGITRDSERYIGDSGGASRFFYCAKASSAERGKDNIHPTVKPIALMKYILKLLAPLGSPTCLDPFAGSGTTLVAAKELGISCIGIEKEPEYFEIAKARINSYAS
jgi:site-specific DNA-methyltransferase (adenine-specific)